jgi:hypothetical protein
MVAQTSTRHTPLYDYWRLLTERQRLRPLDAQYDIPFRWRDPPTDRAELLQQLAILLPHALESTDKTAARALAFAFAQLPHKKDAIPLLDIINSQSFTLNFKRVLLANEAQYYASVQCNCLLSCRTKALIAALYGSVPTFEESAPIWERDVAFALGETANYVGTQCVCGKDSLRWFRAARRLMPFEGVPMANTATTLGAEGRHRFAALFYDRACQVSPDRFDLRAKYASCLVEIDPHAAITQAKISLYGSPNSEAALWVLGQHRYRNGDYSTALVHARRALKTEPGAVRSLKLYLSCLKWNPEVSASEDPALRIRAFFRARVDTDEKCSPYLSITNFRAVFGETYLATVYDALDYDAFEEGRPGSGSNVIDTYLDRIETLLCAAQLRNTTSIAMEILVFAKVRIWIKERNSTQYSRAAEAKAVAMLESFRRDKKLPRFIALEMDLALLSIKNLSEEEFRADVTRLEEEWLNQVRCKFGTGAQDDIRHELLSFVNLHIMFYLRTKSDGDLERVLQYLEVLRGQTWLYYLKTRGPDIHESYEYSLPVRPGSRVIELRQLMSSLQRYGGPNPIAILMHQISDPVGVIPPRLVSITVEPSGSSIREIGNEVRFSENCNQVRGLLQHMAREGDSAGVPQIESDDGQSVELGVYSEKGGPLHSVEQVATRMVQKVNNAWASLARLSEGFCNIVPEQEIAGRTVWFSPPKELYGIPLSLLQVSGQCLFERAQSVVIVPAFSIGTPPTNSGRDTTKIIYGQKRWCEAKREELIDPGKKVQFYPANDSFPFEDEACDQESFAAVEDLFHTAATLGAVVHSGQTDWQNIAAARGGSFGHFCFGLLGRHVETPLVILESCETRNIYVNGESIMGPWVCLLGAGVKKLIASPFTVRPYGEGMREFFAELYNVEPMAPPHEIAEALKKATLELRMRCEAKDEEFYKSPVYWGAYELVAALPLVAEDDQE